MIAAMQLHADLSYAVLGLVLTLGWFITLTFFRTSDPTILGAGPEEFSRIFRASLVTFGTLAMISIGLSLEMSRGYIAVAFPLGLALLVVERWIWRRRLQVLRRRGHSLTHILVIGGPETASDMALQFQRHPSAGYVVAGVWVPDQEHVDTDHIQVGDARIPVAGSATSLRDAVRGAEARSVLVSDSEHLGHGGLRELIWALDGTGVGLQLAPSVVDVVSSRLDMVHIAAMPLLVVRAPTYGQAETWRKLVIERTLAVLAVIVLSPAMAVTAIAVKLSSKGPIFFRQERIGKDGEPFSMLKFRSMYTGADAHLHDLLVAAGQTGTPLPKLRQDPRVTPVGQFIRRYSIDELPQLFNVLRGQMSLVGPRPQREFEMRAADAKTYRRLQVRPGMTGLWQVSGRSNMHWEEALRLDMTYVENWSLAGDLIIMWRTFRAVLSGRGAY